MTNWKNNPAFQRMDRQKQEMVELLAKNLNHRNLNESIIAITGWQRQLAQKNIKFTSEENQILTEVFFNELSPEQKRQFELIKPFFNN